MRRLDAGALVVLIGGFAAWMGLTDTALLYVRPSTGRWLVVAGAVLVVLGVVLLVRSRLPDGSDDDHDAEEAAGHRHHAGRIGWLLAVPVAVAIAVGANPLGSYAAGRQTADRLLPPGEFDLEQYLRAGSFGGQAPPLRVLDYVRAADDPEDRPLLADTEVTLTGFVTEDETSPDDGFYLTRFTIGCCAADAIAVLIRVDLPEGAEVPEADEWVTVTGTLDPSRSPASELTADPPTIDATRVEPTDRPTEVYEYPP